ncbi:heat shock 70 kDa protein 12B-like isoform X2 [Mercenaria mercenaria]|uniref:heat shock 70 kDa protein 12B-like isoform X2 n=1 Tax=Mercenaria mercenaria TaxID=6596 RepID=UPI00234F97D1|nr:heat shock 70 kDa protein 12B-like isoform X2 [Mercenaria mercenaria]XP_045203762.2 heat shock 70 kDa protein 12B-like isoform X2 [Mercenaria mercenaria]XP_053399100.1 heat shock 70 kDa protein 12B-like isoform X2 [Mercenaria mercenaria]XP_053399101.1 heat shock 70 kDa protein 12B-like isoform X2 [Mercenaria mercenaria]XP_053399102.1 heat shock 70 kDa protein 12B-like isoform X2 [Mercenaria mercenaria]XP_053399103.1 heat shock 70 kDa protein 12B-like isoform X2 [Mercenaria mercenaria]XP_05
MALQGLPYEKVQAGMASLPVVASAVHERLQVAAIDFGTTYSGYAVSFRAEFLENPLKIFTYNWTTGSTGAVSLKTSSCILFDPNQKFHSFGFEAEDKYAKLAADEEHFDWYYFKRFKMLLYENKRLTRTIKLKDDKGLEMPAMKVVTECIRYLKDHLIKTCEDKKTGLNTSEMHWVLTVPAIWDDSAKQFMREAAIEAGIETQNLSLALEPEAASLFCRYLPIERVQGADGVGRIASLAPGKRYLVLDAGGGTVDITVHETQTDSAVREIYKANGGPWGGTKIDEAFLDFLTDIAGLDTIEIFERDFKEDFLDLFREFEIKKKTFGPELEGNQKITFKIPLCVHETYNERHGEDFRRSLLMKQDLKDQITFTGDKLRVQSDQVKKLFDKTCQRIVSHLRDIFAEPAVRNTDTILMVGGFSESKMLQNAIKHNFPDKKVIIPEEAGLAVLKGAVIFGHNPNMIVSRVARKTYGVKVYRTFNPDIHPAERKVIIDGVEKCRGCFCKHVEVGQEIPAGMAFDEKSYHPRSRSSTSMASKIYTSSKRNPVFVEDRGCKFLGQLPMDVSHIKHYRDRIALVRMIYGNTELGVEVRNAYTGEKLSAKFDFLE